MKIIVPLRAKTWAELLPKLDQITERVDLVEIWIDELFMDLMRNPMLLSQVTTRLQKLKEDNQINILCVCKSPQEHGQFGGNSTQRVELLKTVLQLGCDFVDLDLQYNEKELIRSLPQERLWVSFHDFDGVPKNLESLGRDMKMIKPAVYKFAVTPQSEAELDQFIEFAKSFSQGRYAIFTTMGPLGAEGRERLKDISYAGFYALNEDEKTATGQKTIKEL